MKPIRIAAVSVASIVWLSFWPGWAFVNSQKVPDHSDLTPQAWRTWWEDKHHFATDQIVWIVPLIKKQACVKAEMAVRHHMRPSPDLLPICGVEDQTDMDADLSTITVSGTAFVNGTKRTFTVKLQHYPPSISETGFIVLSIDLEQMD